MSCFYDCFFDSLQPSKAMPENPVELQEPKPPQPAPAQPAPAQPAPAAESSEGQPVVKERKPKGLLNSWFALILSFFGKERDMTIYTICFAFVWENKNDMNKVEA